MVTHTLGSGLGFSNQVDVELDMINAISPADIAFIMSSSQSIVN